MTKKPKTPVSPVARPTVAPKSAPSSDREDLIVLAGAAVSSAGAIALYAATAARDIVLGDTAELATVAATLGVAHPPGYPLLTLLGHLLTATGPAASTAFRANLVSVLAGGIGGGIVFLTAHRLTHDWTASLGAAALLAVQPLVWEWSLVIEPFALNACLALAVLYAVLRWHERPDEGRWLVGAAFLTGLGIANHHTIVVVAVPAIAALWIHRTVLRQRPTVVLLASVALVPGCVLYAYLPWAAAKGPVLNWGNISTMDGLIAHFLRASYGTFTLSTRVTTPSPTGALLGAFAGTFLGVEAVLLAAGLVLAYRRCRRALWTLGLTALLAGPVFAVVSAFDLTIPGYAWVLKRFFVLPHVLLAPLIALALAEACSRVRQLLPAGGARLASGIVAAAIAGVVFAEAHASYAQLNQRENHLARQFASDILASLPARAVLVSDSDAVTLPVAYLQAVEGLRPDVVQLMAGPLSRGDWYIPEVRAARSGLRIPFDHYDSSSQTASLRAIVDANPNRPFAIVGRPPDGSLEPAYWFLPMGLTLLVEPASQDVALTDMEAENERLFAAYHLPGTAIMSHANFDPYILRAYASGARFLGLQYLGAGQPDVAARWLHRALAIDPSDEEARALLKNR